jgi:hypothetical protein
MKVIIIFHIKYSQFIIKYYNYFYNNYNMNNNGGFPPLKYIIEEEKKISKSDKSENKKNRYYSQNIVDISSIINSVNSTPMIVQNKQEVMIVDEI